jgi:hypothetical protein
MREWVLAGALVLARVVERGARAEARLLVGRRRRVGGVG